MNMNKIFNYIKIYYYIYFHYFTYPYSEEFDTFIDKFITRIYHDVIFLTKDNNSVIFVLDNDKYQITVNNFPEQFMNKVVVYDINNKLDKVLFYKVRCSRRNMVRFSKLLLDNKLTIIGSTFF